MTLWGPQLQADGTTRFRLWAPDLDSLTLVLDAADGPRAIPMTRADAGWFSAVAPAVAGSGYRFRLPDGTDIPDPASRRQRDGVHGWSVVEDPSAYPWRNTGFAGRPMREMVIYEAHAGIAGGYAGLMAQLPELARLGITAVELMPVGAFSGDRNWGYDGVLPFAPVEAYGTPDDLRAFVDAAHGLGIAVLLDVVYNHFGPDGNYLPDYASPFFVDRHTGWGLAVAVERDDVARYFVENALMWVRDYRIDGLRFDAVHAIDNPRFLDSMAAEVRAAVPDRTLTLILENEHNDADRLVGAFDAQWNDDFHNAIHVLLTGEVDSYYEKFSRDTAQKLARALGEGFAFQGELFGDKPRGNASDHLPPTAFVNFLQNHDQVGNRAFGERLTKLTARARLEAATALLLLSPFPPLLFMGEEVGSESPFLFFTDFHDQLADAVREGRRKEFAEQAAYANAAKPEDIPDPNDPATFAASRVQPGPRADEWRDLYTRLLALRARAITPHLDAARTIGTGVVGPAAVWARWRLGNGAELVILVNLGDAGVSYPEAPDGPALFQIGDTRNGAGCSVWLRDDSEGEF